MNYYIINFYLKDEDEGESDSSSDTEDEVGELITEKINNKFLETIAKIRQKNPDIYDENKKFFKGFNL